MLLVMVVDGDGVKDWEWAPGIQIHVGSGGRVFNV